MNYTAATFTFTNSFFLIIVFLLMIIGIIFIMSSLVKNLNSKIKDKKFNFILSAIFIVGIILRIVISFLVKGDSSNLNNINDLYNKFSNGGLGNIYENGYTFMPISAYLIYFFNIIAGSSSSMFHYFVLKLPFIIADCVVFFVLLDIFKKFVNKNLSIILASCFFLNPVFIYNSSIYLSTITFAVPALLLALKFMLEKRYVYMIVAAFISLMLDSISFYIEPIFVFYTIYSFYKVVKANKTIEKTEKNKMVFFIPISFVICLILGYVITLPLIINQSNNILVYLNVVFFNKYTSFTYYTFNGLSIFSFFSKNGIMMPSNFNFLIFSILYRVIVYCIILFMFFNKKNRANLLMVATLVLFTMCMYFIDFNAYSMLPILILLLFNYSVLKDKRIIKIFVILSSLIFLNATLGIINAGDMSNTEETLINSPLAMNSGISQIFYYIFSALTLITHVYFTLTSLDICLMNNRRLLQKNKENDLFNNIKQYFI